MLWIFTYLLSFIRFFTWNFKKRYFYTYESDTSCEDCQIGVTNCGSCHRSSHSFVTYLGTTSSIPFFTWPILICVRGHDQKFILVVKWPTRFPNLSKVSGSLVGVSVYLTSLIKGLYEKGFVSGENRKVRIEQLVV